MLGAAGFAEAACEAFDAPFVLMPGATLDAVAGFLMEVGPVARPLAEADAKSRARFVAKLRAAIEPHFGPDGFRLAAASWIVTARRA